ncbi:unnamed protein product [Sphagnum compactum]
MNGSRRATVLYHNGIDKGTICSFGFRGLFPTENGRSNEVSTSQTNGVRWFPAGGEFGQTIVMMVWHFVMELVRFELVVQGGLEDNDLGDETHLLGDGLLEGEEPQYKDEIDCLKQLVVKEGPASLYSGLVPQLLGIAPKKAMKLTVNEMLLGVLETMMPGARIWLLEFIAGGGGRFSQVVFTNPMEIVKVRLQTQAKGGVPKTMFDVVRKLRVLGLYRGTGITMARDVPSSAIFFACYTLLQQLYPDQNFMARCLAAIPATVLVTPMDIIKTRLQV